MTVPFATCRQALHASTYRHRVYLCHWRQLRTTISLARVGAPANSGSGVGGDCRVNLQACNRGPLMHALCGLSDNQAIITFLLPSIIRILGNLPRASSTAFRQCSQSGSVACAQRGISRAPRRHSRCFTVLATHETGGAAVLPACYQPPPALITKARTAAHRIPRKQS